LQIKKGIAEKSIRVYMNSMARASDPRYRNHPLKVLRETIGLSQTAFAEVTGCSLDALRSLEVGRRAQGKMPPEMLAMIFVSIGASWDEEDGEWTFGLTSMNTPMVPYAKEHYQTFRQELLQEAHERDSAVLYLISEFLNFLQAIPPKAFNGWFWKLDYLFRKWRKDVNWPKTGGYTLMPLWDYKSARVLGYRKMFFSLLEGEEFLDGQERKFDELIKRAREQAEKDKIRSLANFDEELAPLEEKERAELSKRGQKRPRRSRRAPGEESKNIS
jgi:DNA-binding transcriptional regulator YiaG